MKYKVDFTVIDHEESSLSVGLCGRLCSNGIARIIVESCNRVTSVSRKTLIPLVQN